MEVSVTVDEKLVHLITSSTKKDITSIVSEALNQWVTRNLLKCPIDEKYCDSEEPCNYCSKFQPNP